jgi:hypothetical protein
MAGPVNGESANPLMAGVTGTNTAAGEGVSGIGRGAGGTGVSGTGNKFGVQGSITPITSTNGVGVIGQGGAIGVKGFAFLNIQTGIAAEGFLGGRDPHFNGFVGVYGTSSQNGVFGRTASEVPEDNAVYGQNDGAGHGVCGVSQRGIGVFGTGKIAGQFVGDVEVTGHINCSPTSKITCFDVSLIGGDCAEDFDISHADLVEPGTVMVLDEAGILQPSQFSYDKRVAGVISGAGDYRPGIVLDKRASGPNRKPIALVGKVYCKVDAQYGSVAVGDLLTTSPTLGYAMKAADPLKAFGAVIGKALQPLVVGCGLIPILVALQ